MTKTEGYTKFFRTLYPAVETVNRIDSRLFIFLLLCLNLLSFVTGDNEEAYFALAKQYADPSWIPGSFTFTEWVGTRFLFQNIVGFALRFLSFEQLTFWGRMFNYACYAFPLALIFKELKIKNLGILCVLQLYIRHLNTQNFFGGEWIFGGFEGKTLAYIFVLYGVYFLLKGRYERAALFAAVATWFHVLVGGWFFVLVFICGIVSDFNVKRLLRTGLVYVAIVLPFVIYLFHFLTDSATVINGVDIDWVYSFFRNPHHTAPMHQVDAMTKVFPRVVCCVALFLLCLFYFRKQAGYIQKLNTIVLITLCMLFAGLVITYIDVNGRILKYYLFRIAAVGMFCGYLMVFLWLRNEADKRFNASLVRVVCLALITILSVISIEKNFSRKIFPKENKELTELAAFVTGHTRPDDIYLFLNKDELSFSRLTRRDAFVIFKFDPGGGEKIYEWYTREQIRRRLRDDISCLDTVTKTYRLNYLITSQPVEQPCLKEVFNNYKYHLYEIAQSN
jgi:hypothetical protein